MKLTDKVRNSSELIHLNSSHVRINEEKIYWFIDWLDQQSYKKYDEIYHPESDELGFEDSLAFIFFVDAINFCFWP